MIRLTAPVEGLMQRLRRRAEQLAARKLLGLRQRRSRIGHPWRSPGKLWPDFTDSGSRN
jgi:hypothetical protein